MSAPDPASFCAAHPKVETALSCSRCTLPICTDCAVSGAVGMLCRGCAGVGKSAVSASASPRVGAKALAWGGMTGLVVSTLIAIAFLFMPIRFFIVAFLGGIIISEAVSQMMVDRRHSRTNVFICGVSVVVGGVLAPFLTGHLIYYATHPVALWGYIFIMVLVFLSAVGKAWF